LFLCPGLCTRGVSVQPRRHFCGALFTTLEWLADIRRTESCSICPSSRAIHHLLDASTQQTVLLEVRVFKAIMAATGNMTEAQLQQLQWLTYLNSLPRTGSGFPNIEYMDPQYHDIYLNGPAQPAPNGTMSNLTNPDNRNDIAFGVTVACIVLTSLCMMGRFWTQIMIKRTFTIEDFLGILGFAAFCGVCWTSFELQRLSMFWTHQWDLSINDFTDILFILYVWPCLYALLMMFAKPAILLEWNRIFVPRGIRNRFWWTCNLLVVFNALFYAASFVAIQFYCSPHPHIWRRYTPGQCRDRVTMDAPSAVFNLLLDIMILLLPQRVIWKLHMTPGKKWGVSFIFGVGILAVVCAVGRVYGVVTLNYRSDVTYNVGPAYLWALAESACVIIVFCVPAIPKMLADSAVFGYMMRTLRSMTSQNPTGPSNASGWTTIPATRTTKKSHTYNGTFDDETDSQVHLADLESASRAHTEGPPPAHVPKGILRTTEITTDEYRATDLHATSWLDPQRPWETNLPKN
jgi:hypothetical protein